MRVPAFASKMKIARFAIERNTQFAQPVDRGGCPLDHKFYRFAIIEARACDHRIANVVFERIARIENGGDAPLRPSSRTAVEPPLRQNEHLFRFGQGQCRSQAGSA